MGKEGNLFCGSSGVGRGQEKDLRDEFHEIRFQYTVRRNFIKEELPKKSRSSSYFAKYLHLDMAFPFQNHFIFNLFNTYAQNVEN